MLYLRIESSRARDIKTDFIRDFCMLVMFTQFITSKASVSNKNNTHARHNLGCAVKWIGWAQTVRKSRTCPATHIVDTAVPLFSFRSKRYGNTRCLSYFTLSAHVTDPNYTSEIALWPHEWLLDIVQLSVFPMLVTFDAVSVDIIYRRVNRTGKKNCISLLRDRHNFQRYSCINILSLHPSVSLILFVWQLPTFSGLMGVV